jgi:prepilin-type N-terminal cleavage/methylation domain-containing protein
VRCTRVRARDREAGFTIIELSVALGLLAVVAAAIAGVFWSAVRTASVANHRTEAAAIASREMEAMHAVPYASVGFYGDETGYTSTFESYTTVTLAGSTPTGTTPLIQPQTPDPSASVGFAPDPDPANANPIVQSNVRYSVRRYVVWASAKDASTTYTNAYKRLTVIASWSDVVGAHSVRQDSLLYPGGQGQYGGATATTTSTPPTTVSPVPTTPVLAAPVVPADPAGRTEIDLTWSQPGGGATIVSYTVQYSTSSTFPAGSTNAIGNLPTNSTTYPVTALASSTTYWFRVVANAATQTATSNAVSASTLAQPAPSCTLGPISVTGATSSSTTGTILKKHGNRSEMSENLTLGFSTTGTCTDAYNVKAVDPTGAADQGSPYTLTANGSGSYSGSVLALDEQGWSVGVHTFTIWDITLNAATTAVKTFKICAIGSASC